MAMPPKKYREKNTSTMTTNTEPFEMPLLSSLRLSVWITEPSANATPFDSIKHSITLTPDTSGSGSMMFASDVGVHRKTRTVTAVVFLKANDLQITISAHPALKQPVPLCYTFCEGVSGLSLRDVESLGRKMGFTTDLQNFHNVSLGQGRQEVVAKE
ncbi:hypothetical protein B566_EDAN005159 [Ephemera danica]|nr:hypothetical protein B566_EDAN005159 [Ephemera danica]